MPSSECLTTAIFCCHLNCLIKRAVYGSWNTKWDRTFCHFGPFFVLLTPPTFYDPKNQNFVKKWKNTWRYYPFIYTCVPYMKIILWYMDPKKQGATDRFLSFWAIFWSFSHLTTHKIKILKLKKTPGDIILHICTINDNHMIYGS